MKHAVIIAAALILIGCNERRDQTAANAIEGVDALVSVVEPTAATVAAEVALGVKANIAATAGTKQAELPAPEFTAEQIIDDPASYRSKAEEDERQATAGFWKQALGWGLPALGVLLGVLKFVPGAHGPIVSVVQGLLESKKDKTDRERELKLANGARTIIDTIEAYGGQELKDKIAKKVSPEAKGAIDEYLATIRQP